MAAVYAAGDDAKTPSEAVFERATSKAAFTQERIPSPFPAFNIYSKTCNQQSGVPLHAIAAAVLGFVQRGIGARIGVFKIGADVAPGDAEAGCHRA